MSNFVVAVGGSGAKLMQTLIHLGAAGMLPEQAPTLTGLLVDPDENNGNVEECRNLEKAYQACKQIAVGNTDLFRAHLSLAGPWTPIRHQQTDSLKEIFNYNQLSANGSVEAELMDLFFERGELEMSVKQGFRGRPAIGATVFANSVNFETDTWKEFRDAVKLNKDAGTAPHILFAGSVFGGSGASGVPTLVRLLSNHLQKDVKTARYGLILFLPFFQFRKVENELIQADPGSFPLATAEALKYYYEREFLKICQTIYAVGEEVPAEMAVSAVGAKEQRNEPHFIELIAGMGALRFFDPTSSGADFRLAVAAREKESRLTWDDLPFDDKMSGAQVRKMHGRLQKLAVFAVAYHYIFYPQIEEALRAGGAALSYWRDWVTNKKVTTDEVRPAAAAVDAYTVKILEWLLHISTPRRANFEPGLVNPNVFATSQGMNWRLKIPREFQLNDLARLVISKQKIKLDDRSVMKRANGARVRDDKVSGPGYLIRVLFDACEVEY